MPWNNTMMVIAANAVRAAALYGQLHTAAAGSSGTSNLASSGRMAVTWASATGPGSFGLASGIAFTGGAASGPIYSITYWSASSGGTFYGEFPFTSGDLAFNASGTYTVTAEDLTGTST